MLTLEWKGDHLELIDQTKLPQLVEVVRCDTCEQVCEAISNLRVRGAPAIGVAAAYGLVLAAMEYRYLSPPKLLAGLEAAAGRLIATRPTAVNLKWALDSLLLPLQQRLPASSSSAVELLLRKADRLAEEDVEINMAIGRCGQQIIPSTACILTHCNAGSLATVGYGTALGVIRAACDAGKSVRVFASETRPRLQGARLTVWELMHNGIDVTLIADSAAGYLMYLGKIDLVVVGADRIANNGDVANKIGTFTLAVLARENRVPFYVAAPLSSFDFDMPNGSRIPIEQRDGAEVREIGGVQIVPDAVKVFNPAFDVTPREFITGIITQAGIFRPGKADSAKDWLMSIKKGEAL